MDVALPDHEMVVTNVGPMLVPSADSATLGALKAKGACDPGKAAVLGTLVARDGGAAIVGAGSGYLAMVLGHLVGPRGHVLAVEAAPGRFALLRENLARNHMDHVVPVPVEAGGTSVQSPVHDAADGVVAVDELLHPCARVDVIVVNCARAAHRVIAGLWFTLVRWRPPLILDFSPEAVAQAGDDPYAAIRGYRSLGYRIQALDQPMLAESASDAEIVTLARSAAEGHCTLLLRPTGASPPEIYHACRDELVRRALSDESVAHQMTHGAPLGAGYGFAFDERVVELPWVLSGHLRGRCLDAGCSLNNVVALEDVLPKIESLTAFTLKPEERSFPELGVSYVYGDLRAMPFADGSFDSVVCLSTLDHVGMDNSLYGDETQRASSPRDETLEAVRELRRVVAVGGELLITVPFGAPQDLGWMRQFDERDLDDMMDALRPASIDVTVFAYGPLGWQVSDRRAAARAEYRDHFTEPQDRAAGARAVACIRAVPS